MLKSCVLAVDVIIFQSMWDVFMWLVFSELVAGLVLLKRLRIHFSPILAIGLGNKQYVNHFR